MDFPAFEPLPALSVGPFKLTVMAEAPLGHPGAETAIKACLNRFVEAWPAFLHQIRHHNLLEAASLTEEKPWEADIIFVGNPTIQAINRDYRQKDQATDVLTFTLYADSPDRAMLSQLPVAHLGSVLISLDWAATETGVLSANSDTCLQNDIDETLRGNLTPSRSFIMFILERMVHGCLHLMGVTHDTDQDYNRVVEIQHYVLNAITG